MKMPKLTTLTLLAAALSASFALQACNTVDGLGEDVSAGADAVSDSATENKGY
ncbi:entericidin, EcnA/B family [Roseovarius sp. EGI FJ00037]|uniref:entericidin, EcnA/B family n=1 Tax=Roseovarius TaxID=74030 RepID=UPI0022A8C202|nr:entericidin, EcnA/B family [Roseovarius sp. EGI FJ00037]MCZ0814183.1 entericidin, EcnA/B family [Roseovarius sp. EGI FJ00037]